MNSAHFKIYVSTSPNCEVSLGRKGMGTNFFHLFVRGGQPKELVPHPLSSDQATNVNMYGVGMGKLLKDRYLFCNCGVGGKSTYVQSSEKPLIYGGGNRMKIRGCTPSVYFEVEPTKEEGNREIKEIDLRSPNL